jgi:hypothetical protein
MVGHMGRINGFSSINTYYPEEKVTVIVLSNQRNVSVHAIGVQLADIVFNVKGLWY